jgi:CRP/FNR family cyclic AMP-dependent transcriptional regulator
METASVVAVLSKTELLGGLSDDDLARVATVVGEARYPGATLLFSEGDLSDAFFVVTDGSVRIFVERADEQTTLGVVGPYQTFGEMALFDAGARAAAAEAVETTSVLRIGRGEWLGLLDREPGLARHVLETLGGLIRRYAHQAVECLFLDLEGRVARLLLMLSERRGRNDEPLLDLDFTQGQLARMVNGSRQSVNQILRRLEAAGYIRTEHGEIAIIDREGLVRRSNVELRPASSGSSPPARRPRRSSRSDTR